MENERAGGNQIFHYRMNLRAECLLALDNAVYEIHGMISIK